MIKLVRDLRGHIHVKDCRKKIVTKLPYVLSLAIICSLCICGTAFADTGATASIDEGVFTTIFNGCKTFLGLFTIFPINIFLGASLVGVIVGIIKKFKTAS